MSWIRKEDYEEPKCLLDMNTEPVEAISVGRMIEKLDEYLSRDDYAAAERHLKYWLSEAEAGRDERGKLSVLNEMIGLYRKLSREAACTDAIEKALTLSESLGLQDSVTGGTTYVNAATGYESFGKINEALALYENAQKVYEKVLKNDDSRLGGLYNNMALCLTAHERFREAEDLFFKALSVMEKQEHGEPEMAITYLNLCDLITAEIEKTAGSDDPAVKEEGQTEADEDFSADEAEAEERISEYLQKAEDLLNTPGLPRNGNYAFVCEKCAPVFGYYGRFLAEAEFRKRAEAIYRGEG
ncbi:MAG: tetratricopeptide repeat protein [Lachnospiraceae bacterium]|nr:tetratricopeptide repeat protein [Lachnospiraceae bacterium]